MTAPKKEAPKPPDPKPIGDPPRRGDPEPIDGPVDDRGGGADPDYFPGGNEQPEDLPKR